MTPGRRSSSRAGGAVALVVVMFGAGCTGSDEASPVDIVAGAVDKTLEARSSHVEFHVDLTDKETSAVVMPVSSGDGNVNLRTGIGGYTFNLPSVGSVELNDVDAVSTASELYLRLPGWLAQGLGDGPWSRIDVETPIEPAQIDLGGLVQSRAADPAFAFALLKGTTSAVAIGRDLSGDREETTHYKVMVDLNRAAASASGGRRPSLERLADQQGRTTEMGVWVDRSDLIRRISYGIDPSSLTFTLGGQGPPSDGNLTVGLDFNDFGITAADTPPSTTRTSDLDSTLRRSGAALRFAELMTVRPGELPGDWTVASGRPFTDGAIRTEGPCGGKEAWAKNVAGWVNEYNYLQKPDGAKEGNLQVTARLLPSSQEASKQFSLLSSPDYIRCDEKSSRETLTAITSGLEVVDSTGEVLPRSFPVRSKAIRVTMRVRDETGEAGSCFDDILVVTTGRLRATFSFVRCGQPFDEGFESRVVSGVVNRMLATPEGKPGPA